MNSTFYFLWVLIKRKRMDHEIQAPTTTTSNHKCTSITPRCIKVKLHKNIAMEYIISWSFLLRSAVCVYTYIKYMKKGVGHLAEILRFLTHNKHYKLTIKQRITHAKYYMRLVCVVVVNIYIDVALICIRRKILPYGGTQMTTL